MMKSVILIRHTKSDWSDMLPDMDRPIRADRCGDAEAVAKEIAKRGSIPGCIVSSPARRTLQTAKVFCEKWDHPYISLAQDEALYEGIASNILSVIQAAKDKYDVIAIIGHNPSVTDFVNRYSDASIGNVPTTGAACITFETKKWKDIKGAGKLKWFLQPKELRKGV